MKTVITFIAAVLMTASASISPASAATLYDGTYKANFAGGCGVLKVTSGGSNINYQFGPCGGAPTFIASGTFDGKVMRIKSARLVVSKVTKQSIAGAWTLRGDTLYPTFRKIG